MQWGVLTELFLYRRLMLSFEDLCSSEFTLREPWFPIFPLWGVPTESSPDSRLPILGTRGLRFSGSHFTHWMGGTLVHRGRWLFFQL